MAEIKILNNEIVSVETGKLGIGTASPAQLLHIKGTNPILNVETTWATGNYGQIRLGYTGGTDRSITGHYDNGMTFDVNGERMRIDSSGNVGIGTTTPSQKLELSGSGNVYGKITSTTTGGNAGVRFLSTNAREYGIFTDGDLRFYDFSASAERMRITSDGNVGIGTTSPSARLHVNGSSETLHLEGASSYTTVKFRYGGSTKGEIVWFEGDSSLYMQNMGGGPILFYQAGNPRLTINTGGNVGIGTTSPAYTITVQKSITDDWIGQISNTYNGAGNGLLIDAGDGSSGEILRLRDKDGSSKVSFLSNGNVGIGTTSPGQKLHIFGGNASIDNTTDVSLIFAKSGVSKYEWYLDNASNNFGLYDRGNSAWRLNVNNAGNVGIGTTNPGKKLEVVGGARIIGGDEDTLFLDTTTTGQDTSIFYSENGQNKWQQRVRNDFELYNYGASSWHFVVKGSSGNVGIGTSSPGAKLEVNGNIKLSSTAGLTATPSNIWLGNDYSNGTTRDKLKIYLYNSGTEQYGFSVGSSSDVQYHSNELHDFYIANSLKVRINNSGNVGIGTTSPDSFLQVKTHTHYDYVHDLHQKIATFNPSNMSGAGSSAAVNIGNGSYGTSGTENLYLQFLNTHGNYGFPVGWRIKSYTDLDTTGANSSFAIQQVRRGNSTSANDGTQPHIDTDFLINQDGNVGIGTTSPGFKLDVAGPVSDWAARFTSNANSSAYFANGAGYGGYINAGTNASSSTYLLSLVSNGSTRVYVRGDGNVGINTTTPGERLDVVGKIRSYSAADNYGQIQNGSFLAVGNHGGTFMLDLDNNGTADLVNIKKSGTSRFYIENAGNVGIGTTTPSATLDVDGSSFLRTTADMYLSEETFLRIGRFGRSSTGTTDRHHYLTSQVSHVASDNFISFNIDDGSTSTGSSYVTNALKLRGDGAIQIAGYGAGFLQTDANGNITAGSVTTSDTLDDVTDNGNSTTNSIVLGASTVDGTMLVRGSYASGNIVVIGGMKSSGGAMIGYAVKPDTSTNHGFVSSSAFTLERAAYYQQGNRHRWYAGASQDVAIGNAVSISETMRLDFDKLGLSTSSPASLIHLGKPTNGTNIITFGEAGIGGPHGIDFYGDDATRTKKFSIYYRTGTENISMEDGSGTKRWEITQSGAVTFNQAFTFPTADGSAGSALVTDGSGSLSWNGGYKQYSPVGWYFTNGITYTATGQNIQSSATQILAGTTPVQRNSATEFQATKAGWYEIKYCIVVKNNYAGRSMAGAYMTISTGSGGGIINGSYSTQYLRYNTYGEYAQIQNSYFVYAPDTVTKFYLFSYLLSGSMNMTTQALNRNVISFRYINNDIT